MSFTPNQSLCHVSVVLPPSRPLESGSLSMSLPRELCAPTWVCTAIHITSDTSWYHLLKGPMPLPSRTTIPSLSSSPPPILIGSLLVTHDADTFCIQG